MKLENEEIITKGLNESYDAVEKLGKDKYRNREFLKDLLVHEPARLAYDKVLMQVVEDTSFIINVIPENIDVIKYMPPKLKEDTEFLNQVVKKYPGTLTDILKHCNVKTDEDGNIVIAEERILLQNEIYNEMKNNNQISPKYANNEKMMTAAIACDAGMILLVGEELKNNKEFIKTEAMKNKEVLEKIVENTDEFGIEGLLGAKEANIEHTFSDSLNDFQTRLEELQKKLEFKGMSVEEQEKAEQDAKRLQRHIKRFKELENNPERREKYFEKSLRYVKEKAEFFKKSCENAEILENAIISKEIPITKISETVANERVIEKDDDELSL